MSTILAHTSPARGHLFPMVPILLELKRRGHRVHLSTISAEVERMRSHGLETEAISPQVEAVVMDDWKEGSTQKRTQRSMRVWLERTRHDRAPVASAIETIRPDFLLIDHASFGGVAVAEGSGLPWASTLPYFAPVRGLGVPVYGPGMRPLGGPIGRLRDRLGWRIAEWEMNKALLEEMNQMRIEVGASELGSVLDLWARGPRIFYLTVPELEYPRDWPSAYRFVGALGWEPDAEAPEWLAGIDRPIVLVTASSEEQDDRALIATTLEAMRDSDAFVIATTAAHDPAGFTAPPNARVERYLPHSAIIERATCVVCHGGMGITQKALAGGVPVCVVPHGRDQLEVARRVEQARCGTSVSAKKLSPDRLRGAIEAARALQDSAGKIATAMAAAPGPSGIADEIESKLAVAA